MRRHIKRLGGVMLQDGTPARPLRFDPSKAEGLLLRGVVLDTFVTDDEEHPSADLDREPVAVYCNVLVYPSIAFNRFFAFRKVLVSQPFGGLHSGLVWKPRPSSIDTSQAALDVAKGSPPAALDGDHVLVGFLNNNFDQPVILRSLPHPSLDTGNEDHGLGKRIKLKSEDGEVVFVKQRGSHYGIDDRGNHVVDTRFAHSGEYADDGTEPDPGTAGTEGNQTQKLPVDSEHTVSLEDMSDPLAPVQNAGTTINRAGMTIRFDDTDSKVAINLEAGSTLEITKADDGAKVVIGDGAVHAAIAEHLESMWSTFKSSYDNHVHPSGTGPTGKPTGFEAPAWDGNIAAGKLTLPDN